jgi:hypothetical protein
VGRAGFEPATLRLKAPVGRRTISLEYWDRDHPEEPILLARITQNGLVPNVILDFYLASREANFRTSWLRDAQLAPS